MNFLNIPVNNTTPEHNPNWATHEMFFYFSYKFPETTGETWNAYLQEKNLTNQGPW